MITNSIEPKKIYNNTIKSQGITNKWFRFYSPINSYIKNIDLTIKIVQTSLDCFPPLSSFDLPIKKIVGICKDTRKVTDFLKCGRTISGLLTFEFTLIKILFAISGMSLSTLSCLILAERIGLIDLTSLKRVLSRIPVLGVLPFGGLLSISIISLLSLVALGFAKKKDKVEVEIKKIKKEKKELLTDYREQSSQTKLLGKRCKQIRTNQLKKLYAEKKEKCEERLRKAELEKRIVFFEICINVMIISNQVLGMGMGIAGIKFVGYWKFIPTCLEFANIHCNIQNIFLRKQLRNY